MLLENALDLFFVMLHFYMQHFILFELSFGRKYQQYYFHAQTSF